MVEVDPVILTGIGVGIVGFCGIISLMFLRGKSLNEAAVSTTKASKQSKKKTKAKKEVSTEAKEKSFVPPAEIANDNNKKPVEPSKPSSQETFSSSPLPSAAPTSFPAPEPEEVKLEATEETNKKGKKSKETPEQKAARMERQRVAKLAESATVQSVLEADKETFRNFALSSQESFAADASALNVVEGWGTVEKKYKNKKEAAQKAVVEKAEKTAEKPVEKAIDKSASCATKGTVRC